LYCDISRRQAQITPLGVFSDAFSGRKMRFLLLYITVPSVIVIWVVSGHPSKNYPGLTFCDQMDTGMSNVEVRLGC
jgi:hypothetical protein